MQKIFFPSLKPRFINQQEVIEGLREIAVRLAAKDKNIAMVYLFGSYANNTAGAYSDADILVVLKQDRRPKIERLDEFILEFADGPIPVDVLVNTLQELDLGLAQGSQFLANAVAGIKLV